MSLLLLLILLTRLPLLWTPFLDVDETLFALYAKIWAHGGIPYIDFVETKAVGAYLFYIVASAFTGSLPNIDMRAVHILSLLWTFATALVIERLGKKLDSEKTGFIAAIFFIVFTSTYIPKIVATNIEVILLLPWVLSVLCLWKKTAELRKRDSFFVGVFLSIAILCKYQAGILIPVVLIYYWLIAFHGESPWTWKKALIHTVFFGVGGLLLPSMMLAYLNHRHGLDAFWFWNFKANAYYIGTGAHVLSWWEVLPQRVLPFLLSTGVVWYLVFQRFMQSLNEGTFQNDRRRELFLWLWLFLSLIPVSMGRRFYPHYFLLLMPPASLLAALALMRLEGSIIKRRALLASFWIPLIGFSAARLFMNPLYDAFHSADNLNVFKPYADYVRTHTQAEDRIFVWGFSPTIYWDADRLPGSRFLTSGYLSGRVYGVSREKAHAMAQSRGNDMPGVWEMFFEDMQKKAPAYVIDMSGTALDGYEDYPLTRHPFLMELLKKEYTEEATFQGAVFYRKKI